MLYIAPRGVTYHHPAVRSLTLIYYEFGNFRDRNYCAVPLEEPDATLRRKLMLVNAKPHFAAFLGTVSSKT
jgi:hypothetical protein